MPTPAPLHAILGNTQTLALLSPEGAVEWAAFPAADAPPCFERFGRSEAGGAFELVPEGECTITRGYLGETNVLETLVSAPGGRAQVLDFLPLRPGHPDGAARVPRDRLVRIVEGLEGTVSFHFRYAPRPDHAGGADLQSDPNGLVLTGETSSLLLQTEAEVHLREAEAVGAFTLAAGEKRHFVLTHLADPDPDVPEMAATEPAWDLDGTFDFWLTRSRRCPFQGAQRQHVLKLANLLKAWWAPPAHQAGALCDRLYASPYALLVPVALTAWGWEDELARALDGWTPTPADAAHVAWLFWALDIGQRTGLIEATLVTPHWARLRPVAEALAGSKIDALTRWVGLRAAADLADELMLPGAHGQWREQASRLAETLEGPAAQLRALGLGAAREPVERRDEEQPFRADLAGACWTIRDELAGGGYLQARRLFDKLLGAFTPLGALPEAEGPLPDVGATALALWTAAEIYLQGAPTAGRVEMPGELGE